MPSHWQNVQPNLQTLSIIHRGVRLANAHFFLPPTKPKTMTHETKTKLKAALATGYIVLTTCLGLAFFGRFFFAIITN